MKTKENGVKVCKAEIILIASILLVGLLLLTLFYVFRTQGSFVRVTLDGECVGEYSLLYDGVYEIGDGNVLTVEDGEAYMSYADCPDKTCVHTGRVSSVGERIVCLPNRVMAEIVRGADYD